MIRLAAVLLLGGWVIYTAGGTQVGGWAIVFGVLALAARFRIGRAVPSGRVMPHAHGTGAPMALRRHEGAHVHAARSEGIRVVRVAMSDTRGTVHLNERDLDRASYRSYMAVMMSGRAAAGPWDGIDCTVDDKAVRWARAAMRDEGWTPGQITREVRLAQADARRHARSGNVDRYATRLGRGEQP